MPAKRKKKPLIILELPIKTAIFFLILFIMVFQQETRELVDMVPNAHHIDLKLFTNFKSFVTLFNNIVLYFKGIY